MKRDKKTTHDAPNCPRWPNCGCTIRGFVNYEEFGNCGRKPKHKQNKPVESRHPALDEILEG